MREREIFFFREQEREKKIEKIEKKLNKKKTQNKSKTKNRTHVEREDLEAFLPAPGAADEAMALLDVDGDGR